MYLIINFFSNYYSKSHISKWHGNACASRYFVFLHIEKTRQKGIENSPVSSTLEWQRRYARMAMPLR